MWQICWLVATLYSLEDRHPFGNLKVSDGERLAVVSKNNIYKERSEAILFHLSPSIDLALLRINIVMTLRGGEGE